MVEKKSIRHKSPEKTGTKNVKTRQLGKMIHCYPMSETDRASASEQHHQSFDTAN